MATLTAPPERPPAASQPVRRPFARGLAAALIAAAVGLAVLAAGTVLLWAGGPRPGQGLTPAPFEGAAAVWLLAQRAAVDTAAGEIRVAPLLLTVGLVAVSVRAVAWAARGAGVRQTGDAVGVVTGFLVGHVALALVAARGGSVGSGDALRTAAGVGLACGFAGVAGQTAWWAGVVARCGPAGRSAVRAGLAGALVLAGGGFVVVAISLAVDHRGTAAILAAVGGGASGGVGMTLLGVALLPNAALWVVALGSGPGFALGTDAAADLGGVDQGALPALPLLAALPASGPLPLPAYLPALLPPVAGALIGWWARPSGPPTRWSTVLGLPALTAVVTGLVVGALAGLSGGGAGGRLAEFGPSGSRVAGALAVELATVAVAVAAGRCLHARRHLAAAPAPLELPPAPVRAEPAGTDAVAEESDEQAQTDGAADDASEDADAGGQESNDRDAVVDDAMVADDAPAAGDLEDLEDTQEIPVVPPADGPPPGASS